LATFDQGLGIKVLGFALAFHDLADVGFVKYSVVYHRAGYYGQHTYLVRAGNLWTNQFAVSQLTMAQMKRIHLTMNTVTACNPVASGNTYTSL